MLWAIWNRRMTLSIKALHLSSKPLYQPPLNNIRYQRDLKGNRERKYDLQKGSIFRVQCSSFPSNMQHILWARYSGVLSVQPRSSKAWQCVLLTNHSLAQNKCSAEGRPKCQHLTGWSPPAFMSQPWYTAWYMILLGNIYIYKYIKLSGVVVGLKLMRSSQKNKGLLTQDVSTCVSTKVFYLRVPPVFNSKKQLKKPPFQQKTTTLKDRTPLK